MKVVKTEIKKLRSDKDRRKARGYDLFSKHQVFYSDTNKYMKFLVRSCDGKSKYTVDFKDWSCTCPDYAYRFVNCKHIFAACYARHEAGYPLEFEPILEKIDLGSEFEP